jgi:hypothetical protein
MKSLLPPALAGASCIPATYWLLRDGSFAVAFIVVAVIGALGGAIAVGMCRMKGRPRLVHLISMFAVGALMSELVSFTRHYVTSGYQDELLFVGILMEALAYCGIVAFGGVATCVAALVHRRSAIRAARSGL